MYLVKNITDLIKQYTKLILEKTFLIIVLSIVFLNTNLIAEEKFVGFIESLEGKANKEEKEKNNTSAGDPGPADETEESEDSEESDDGDAGDEEENNSFLGRKDFTEVVLDQYLLPKLNDLNPNKPKQAITKALEFLNNPG